MRGASSKQSSYCSSSSRNETVNLLVSYPQEEFGRLILRRFIRIFTGLNAKILLLGDREIVPGVGLLHVRLPRQPGILRYSFFQAGAWIALWRTLSSLDDAWFVVG